MDIGEDRFTEVAQVIGDGGILLRKYKSMDSGLTVCIAQAEGPIVAGFMCIATEAHDDDGLPHTLEHLIFLGSEKYPYKGVLDLISNRCLASGTNAWTDTDNTCYLMTTAGYEGFLNLLPIYLEHILYPTLTDSGYITEVHHVNSNGENAGIVYCEMQGRENSCYSRCHLALFQAMYPGKCGYKSTTGGLLKNLRESTSNIKVRDYHKEFYRPENISVIIAGQIEPKDVFLALKPIESKILQKGRGTPFERPWQSPVPPLLESVTVPVSYPCDDEKFGSAMIAWRGPEIKEYFQFIALEVLLGYLTNTSIAPLRKEFVESANPICSYVDFSVIENSASCFYIRFHNVVVDKIETVRERLNSLLEDIVKKTNSLDMERMRMVIQRKKLSILSQMESNPHSAVASRLIGDFLFGNVTEDLEQRLQNIPILKVLSEKDEEYWTNLIKTYMLDGKYVYVIGRPSCKLAAEMTAEEKSRVETQKKELGPEGLKKKGELLERSIEENEAPAPDHVLNSVALPSVEFLKFHSIKRFCNGIDGSLCSEFDLSHMPCRFQVDDVQSNFVQFYVLLDTSDVSVKSRVFFPLFVELLTESAIRRNGVVISHEEVVKQLANDTIALSASIGLNYKRFTCQEISQAICLSLKVEQEKYEKAVQWIRELLYETVFEVQRVRAIASRMVTAVASMKTEGNIVANLLMNQLLYAPESNRHSASMMRQYAFLTKLLKDLDAKPDEIIKSLNDVRDKLTKLDKITVHIGGNISTMKKATCLEGPWKTVFTQPAEVPISRCPVKQCHNYKNKFDPELNKGLAIGLSSVDSTYLYASATCINSYNHPDYPALLVLIQYLTQLEGPLWKQIRGLGLAYHYSIYMRPNEGLIYFHLFKCTHVVKAYQKGQEVVESHLKGKTPWEQSLLESACGSLMFAIIDQEKTVASVVKQSFSAYCKDIQFDFTKVLLEKISKVTFEDMERVGKKYLEPLFDPKITKCSLCCHFSKVEEVVKNFNELSREFTILPSLECPLLSD